MSDEQELRRLKQEKYQRLLFEAYRRDPLYWYEHRLGLDPKSFHWSAFDEYKDHQWDGDVDPLKQAWDCVANVYTQIQKGETPEYRKVGVEAATGTSKTYWLARLVTWFLDCHEGSLVVTSAPKQDQLKLGLWSEVSRLMYRLKKVRPNSKLYKMRLAMDDRTMDKLDEDEVLQSDSWHAVGFVAGVGSEEQSATKARGFHRKDMMIILEECTGMPNAVINAFQNTSTGQHNVIVAVGNPDNEFDPLHQFCIQEDTRHFRISALDYPNIVMQKEVYPGAVTQVSINDRKKVYGETSPMFQAMVRGISPQQAEDSLIKLEWIEQCIELEIGEEDHTYNAVGVDVANSEAGDKAALAWGQGSVLKELQEFYCKNATHLAYNLFYTPRELEYRGYDNYNTKTIHDFGVEGDCIGIDAVGVGVATVNACTDMGLPCQALQGGLWEEAIPKDDNDKPLYRFESLRSQMYWKAREDLRLKKVSLDVDDKELLKQLKKELCIPKFDAQARTISVESKKHIKKRLGGQSPNLMDAFVYWNWTRQGYRIYRFGFAGISAGD